MKGGCTYTVQNNMYYLIARENYFEDSEPEYDFRPLQNVKNKSDCEIIESIIRPKCSLRAKEKPYIKFYERFKEKGFNNDKWFIEFLYDKITDIEKRNEIIKELFYSEVKYEQN